jgi:cellulose synthase/poly-beta-1,6-N-acetylglucosamine synthase-like glycosyltransferase
MESIAVIVTVYLHPKRAGDIAKKILADEHADKKLIIAVDGETNMDIEAALDPWRGQAEILYSGASIGKTASLESACSGRSEDILLFLDNDVLLPDDRAFLSKLAGRMRAGDIIDLPKEAIGKGLIAHMIGLEFMTSAISQQILASVARRCPAVMGAAFGVRRSTFEKIGGFRRVAYEDLDFGARAFRQHARFVFDRNLKVGTDVPETLVEWLGQRKRWALGNIQWLREYFLVMLRYSLRSPSFLLSALLLFAPAVAYPAVYLILRAAKLTALLPLFYMLADRFNAFAGLFLWLAHIRLDFYEGAISALAGAAVSMAIYFGSSRFLKYRFNPLEFLFYYFIYAPLWVAFNFIMWLLLILKIDPKLDWKT